MIFGRAHDLCGRLHILHCGVDSNNYGTFVYFQEVYLCIWLWIMAVLWFYIWQVQFHEFVGYQVPVLYFKISYQQNKNEISPWAWHSLRVMGTNITERVNLNGVVTKMSAPSRREVGCSITESAKRLRPLPSCPKCFLCFYARPPFTSHHPLESHVACRHLLGLGQTHCTCDSPIVVC